MGGILRWGGIAGKRRRLARPLALCGNYADTPSQPGGNTMPTVRRLQHASVPMPPGGADEARRFYAGALGMPEIHRPRGLSHLTLVWFSAGDDGDEVHCFEEENSGPNSPGQHLCLEVEDLEACRARVEEHGFPVEAADPIYNRPRFFVHDPFGNRVELTQILGQFE
jgi:catechol 2,3-dioxygenase-like lactoylglutathione lyase family enzyme